MARRSNFGYSDFLVWAMSDRLDGFYEGLRWPGWEAEAEAIGPDAAFSVAPPLGFETTAIADRSRRPVPARELWSFGHEVARQVADLPNGTEVEFRL